MDFLKVYEDEKYKVYRFNGKYEVYKKDDEGNLVGKFNTKVEVANFIGNDF